VQHSQAQLESNLGPLKFIIYAAELHECIARHGVMVHSFADDTQLCIQTKIQHVTQAKQKYGSCHSRHQPLECFTSA